MLLNNRTSRYSQSDMKWIKCLNDRPQAKLSIICFPHAGGGINIYRQWPDKFNQDIEIHAVSLPGRELRHNEECIDNMDEITDSITYELQAFTDKPIVFFGHSMGAVIAYETALKMKKIYNNEPKLLFVSGRRAPHVRCGGDFHLQPDNIFIDELLRLNGTPAQVFEDDELCKLVLPMLRNDYKLLETYRHDHDIKLDCSIIACAGMDDSDVYDHELQAWGQLTSNEFNYRYFRGDHFYINGMRSELAKYISEYLERCLC